MPKRGRPMKIIEQDQFEKLCWLQCTKEEIACFFDCSEDTIENWCKRTYKDVFSVVYKKHSAGGKMSLRRYQMELAKKNASMAIWLGKQYLGQKDHIETEDSEAMKRAKEILAGVESAID